MIPSPLCLFPFPPSCLDMSSVLELKLGFFWLQYCFPPSSAYPHRLSGVPLSANTSVYKISRFLDAKILFVSNDIAGKSMVAKMLLCKIASQLW